MWNPERFHKAKKIFLTNNVDLFTIATKMPPLLWSENEVVLDYGCGEGKTTSKFLLPKAKETNSVIYGVDISPEMIHMAQEINSDPDVINYSVGDILETGAFPYAQLKFDKIFLLYSLHWIKNYREALRRFYKILKPGGHLAFISETKFVSFHLLEELGRHAKWEQYMKGYKDYIPEWIEKDQNAETEIKMALAETGYKTEKVMTIDRHFTCDFDGYTEFCISLNPFLGKIPSQLHPELKLDYEKTLKEFFGVVDCPDKVDCDIEIIVAVARKGED